MRNRTFFVSFGNYFCAVIIFPLSLSLIWSKFDWICFEKKCVFEGTNKNTALTACLMHSQYFSAFWFKIFNMMLEESCAVLNILLRRFVKFRFCMIQSWTGVTFFSYSEKRILFVMLWDTVIWLNSWPLGVPDQNIKSLGDSCSKLPWYLCSAFLISLLRMRTLRMPIWRMLFWKEPI